MIEEVYFDRKDAVINRAARSCSHLYTCCNGRKDTFEIVDDFPKGYVVWNIGRDNVPFPCYIPLAKRKRGSYDVDVSTLKTVRCSDEETALRIMKEACRHTVFRTTFIKLINELKQD